LHPGIIATSFSSWIGIGKRFMGFQPHFSFRAKAQKDLGAFGFPRPAGRPVWEGRGNIYLEQGVNYQFVFYKNSPAAECSGARRKGGVEGGK
jgi:hypothetical protein